MDEAVAQRLEVRINNVGCFICVLIAVLVGSCYEVSELKKRVEVLEKSSPPAAVEGKKDAK